MKWLNGKKVTSDVVANALPTGWRGLAERLVADLDALGWDGTVHQVKEKFAELRFYTSDADELVCRRIQEAEEESRTSCQTCGEPGVLTDEHGWVSVLCGAHGSKDAP